MVDVAKALAITQTMLHMRDAMRSLWGANYDAKIAEWQGAITHVAEGKRLQPLQAAIALTKAADGHPMAIMAAMAAFVELEEKSINADPLNRETANAHRA